MFADRNAYFPQIPLRFEAGHWEYLEVWEYLFSYEVYSMLLNSRRSDSKDERPLQAGLDVEVRANSRKQLMFVGYAVLGREPSGCF